MSQFLMPDDLNSSAALTTIFATCWDLLEAAAAGNGTGWRLPVLATQSSQGIQQRTIVLRTVLRPRNSLLFHTDVRSAKIEQLQADANEQLAKEGIVSELVLKQSKARASELATRYDIEQKRIAMTRCEKLNFLP